MPKKLSKKKEYYLSTAGFVIKISLLPTEQIQYKKLFESFIEEVWGDGGFILKNKKKHDYEILVTPEIEGVPLIQKKEKKEAYHFSWQIDKDKKKAKTYYHLSPYLLAGLIRDIIMFLLKKEGLLIHASACIDTKGKIFVFLAHQGGGKSTTADLLASLEDFQKVADDLFVVRKIKDEWKFFSPPLIEKDQKPMFVWSSKADLYFVKKAKKCSKKKLDKGVLKKFLPQIWLKEGEVEKETLKTATEFVSENEFFEFKNCLKPKEIRKTIYEN